MRAIALFISMLLASIISYGQTSRTGLLPELIVSKKLNEQWQVTGQLESMNQLFQSTTNSGLRSDYDYVRTDFTVIGTYRLNPSIKLSGGLLNRFTQGEHVLRGLQQISITNRGSSLRLGHRIRTDQTYSDEATTHRIRYRLSKELPLKGLTLNEKEWYLKSSLEHLTIIQSSEVNMEQRINLAFGKLIKEGQRLEMGWDYRTRTLVDWDDPFQLWFMVNYYISIK